jgi:hypothetical protein
VARKGTSVGGAREWSNTDGEDEELVNSIMKPSSGSCLTEGVHVSFLEGRPDGSVSSIVYKSLPQSSLSLGVEAGVCRLSGRVGKGKFDSSG